MPLCSNSSSSSRLIRSFKLPDAVDLGHEPDGQLEPIVGQSVVDPRLEAGRGDAVEPIQIPEVLLADDVAVDHGVSPGDFQHELLGAVAIGRVGDRHGHLFPEERQGARVVVDRLLEDLRVGDADDPSGELPAADPDLGVAACTEGGWPISRIVVCVNPRAITSPRTPPMTIRSPIRKTLPRRITK